MPNRINPIAKYLFALAGMICAYTAYARLAVPWLEGPTVRVQRVSAASDAPTTSDLLDKSYLANLVPPGEWELEPCKTLLTPQGTVYFRTWDRIDNEGTYRIVPFTLVINDPASREAQRRIDPDSVSDEDTAPVILRSFQGAEVKFSRPLSAGSQNEKATMESARLEGRVTVFRPPTDTEEEEVRVVTSNVHVDRQNIYTLNEVHFQFGAHTGSGRNLSIRLAHETEAAAAGFSTITGIEKLELAYVSQLVLQPSNSFAFQGVEQSSPQPKIDDSHLSLANQKTPLQLSCAGPFVYRMKDQIASFRDRVVVTQLDSWGDNLHCDSLQIEFAKASTNKATSNTANTDSGNTAATEVKTLLANGQPGQPAVLRSNSRDTTIVSEQLAFDVPSGNITARGSAPVTIRNPRLEFEVTQLNYSLQKDNRIGPMNAIGPGKLVSVAGEDGKKMDVSFSDRLEITRLDEQKFQIALDGNAVVTTATSRIASQELDFEIWELPAVLPKDPGTTKANFSKSNWEYLPSKVTATQDVEFETDRLVGKSNQLVADWPRPVLKENAGVLRPDTGLVAMRPITRRHTVRLVGYDEPTVFAALPKPKTKMRFRGDAIHANVYGDLEEMKLADLSVTGELFVENKPLPGDKSTEPFQLFGVGLAMTPQGDEGLYRATVYGSDEVEAKFITETFAVSGKNLQLDQQANTMWVEGAGKLDLDADSASTQTRITAPPGEGNVLGVDSNAKLEKIEIAWAGGMIFDGSQVYFERDVLMKAKQQPRGSLQSALRTVSQAMNVTLSTPFKFRRDANSKTRPKAKRITLVNQVASTQQAFRQAGFVTDAGENRQTASKPILVENLTRDAGGKLTQAQRLRVSDVDFDIATGEITALGPGSAVSYQPWKSGANAGQLLPSKEVDKSKTLGCVHVNFDGKLTANQRNNTMRIEGNTRTAWAPVATSNEIVDPDKTAALPSNAVLIKGDQLDFVQWKKRGYANPVNVIQANGNAIVRGRLFEALGHTLRYDDFSDVITVQGSRQSVASLSHRESEKSPVQSLRMDKIRYHLTEGWAQVDDFRSGSGGLPKRNK